MIWQLTLHWLQQVVPTYVECEFPHPPGSHNFGNSHLSVCISWISFKFWLLLLIGHMLERILALIDHVSRAHETEIRPSVCGIDYLWTYCMNFCKILVVALSYPRMFFEFLKKKTCFFLIFHEYFSFSLPCGIAWEQILQNTTTPTNRSQKFSNFSWFFLPMVLTKLLWRYLKFWLSNF